jgi:hypothetical protein
MFESDCKFNFVVVFEELLEGAMWKTLPKDAWQGAQKKKGCFYTQNHRFSLFPKIYYYTWFYMKKSSLQLLRYDVEIFGFFQENL